MKIDLRELVHRKLDWNDKIPDELYMVELIWKEMINEINNIKFDRAVFIEDVFPLVFNNIDVTDTKKKLFVK